MRGLSLFLLHQITQIPHKILFNSFPILAAFFSYIFHVFRIFSAPEVWPSFSEVGQIFHRMGEKFDVMTCKKAEKMAENFVTLETLSVYFMCE